MAHCPHRRDPALVSIACIIGLAVACSATVSHPVGPYQLPCSQTVRLQCVVSQSVHHVHGSDETVDVLSLKSDATTPTGETKVWRIEVK